MVALIQQGEFLQFASDDTLPMTVCDQKSMQTKRARCALNKEILGRGVFGGGGGGGGCPLNLGSPQCMVELVYKFDEKPTANV